jgi:Zn-dependent protease with chaperone function
LDPATAQRQVLGGFSGVIEPVELAGTYHLGIFLVALVMVLLPVLYVGLICLVGYLLCLYAVNGVGIMRGGIFAIVVYLGPLLAGGILILFMIKPIFAPSREQRRIRSVTGKSDPLLFAFVQRVCHVVGSPEPKRIDVNTEVNASAGFRRGLLSMFGDDLVLTIGLPLVAGFNLRQLAGVLGHEFGHFTQGAGMRLTYLVRTIGFWLHRAVYERDEWDERLVQWSKQLDLRLGVILYLAMLFVWITRKILWVFMVIGYAVGGYLLREMEYDADRHEARVAGSDVFESTCRRLNVLSVSSQKAYNDLGEFYQEGRLCDNLPGLIVANAKRMPKDVRKAIDESISESSTGLFDTHPADKDRIANARSENAPGVFRLEYPATVLFRDFPVLSRNVTVDFYRMVFGKEFKPSELHPLEDLLERQSKEEEADEALGRFFLKAFSSLRPLKLKGELLGPPTDPRGCAASVKQSRKRMEEDRPAYAEAYEEFDQADTHILEADQALAIARANCRIKPDDFSFPMSSSSDARKAKEMADGRHRKAVRRMESFESAATERLTAALQLLYVPQVAARIENAAMWQDDATRVFSAAKLVAQQLEPVKELRNEYCALGAMVGKLDDNSDNQVLLRQLHSQMETVLWRMGDIRQELSLMPYPLDHAKGNISMGDYVLSDLPHQDDLGGIHDAGRAFLETMPGLYARLMGRLVLMAEKAESILGLKPLPPPPDKEPSA